MAVIRTEDSGAEAPVKGSGRAPEGMAGLGKGLAVIEAFGARSSRLTVSEAAEITGTTRAAARRCLLTLVELGYVAHDGKYFRPTPRMLRLGSSYLEADPLPTLAQPHLAAARDELQESVSLAVLEEGWSVFVARAEIAHLVSTGVRVGARLPAYCSATGRVLLAGLEDEQVQAALRAETRRVRTPRTVTDPAALFALVLEARERGYAIIDEELELGMRALSVPVRSARGHLVAALSVSAASGRVATDELRARLLPVLLDRAAAISKTL